VSIKRGYQLLHLHFGLRRTTSLQMAATPSGSDRQRKPDHEAVP
jgi:hypothetical protein